MTSPRTAVAPNRGRPAQLSIARVCALRPADTVCQALLDLRGAATILQWWRALFTWNLSATPAHSHQRNQYETHAMGCKASPPQSPPRTCTSAGFAPRGDLSLCRYADERSLVLGIELARNDQTVREGYGEV